MSGKKVAAFLIGLALLIVLAFSAFSVSTAAPLAPTCGTIHTTDLQTWDLSQTRSEGHNEVVEGGLHVWTTSNSSQAKAAGYFALGVPLPSIWTGAIDFDLNGGSVEPGLQLVLDVEGDNIPDGILVGERVYNEEENEGLFVDYWWLTPNSIQAFKDAAPRTGDGQGSPWYGTLPEWGIALPDVSVSATGYSLGSGVQSDGILKWMRIGCFDFTFGLPQPTPTPTPTSEGTPPPEETQEPTPTGTPTPVAPIFTTPSGGFACRVFVAQAVEGNHVYAQVLASSEWEPWDGFVLQDQSKVEAPGMVEVSLHANYGESVNYAFFRVVGTNTPSGSPDIRFFERTQGGVCREVNNPLTAASDQ